MFLIMLMKKKWLETEVDVFDHVDEKKMVRNRG
jgi:hypothetical protein